MIAAARARVAAITLAKQRARRTAGTLFILLALSWIGQELVDPQTQESISVHVKKMALEKKLRS